MKQQLFLGHPIRLGNCHDHYLEITLNMLVMQSPRCNSFETWCESSAEIHWTVPGNPTKPWEIQVCWEGFWWRSVTLEVWPSSICVAYTEQSWFECPYSQLLRILRKMRYDDDMFVFFTPKTLKGGKNRVIALICKHFGLISRGFPSVGNQPPLKFWSWMFAFIIPIKLERSTTQLVSSSEC